MLNEYVKENKPYIILDLPNIVADTLEVTPDEIRNKWKRKESIKLHEAEHGDKSNLYVDTKKEEKIRVRK